MIWIFIEEDAQHTQVSADNNILSYLNFLKIL